MISDTAVWNELCSCLRSGSYQLNGDELVVVCPGCGDDEQHFSVNVHSGAYNCYKCPTRGTIKRFISSKPALWQKHTLSKKSPVRETKENRTDVHFFPLTQLVYPSQTEGAREGKGNAFLGSRKTILEALDYCYGRGLSPEQIEKYQVSLCNHHRRVFFPYWNDNREITFYMGRLLDNSSSEPKTLEPKNTVKPLFGRHVNKLKKWCVLVEGVFDHLVTPNSYAIMGSNITVEQLETLKEDGIVKVVLFFDGDADEKVRFAQKKLSELRVKSFPIRIDIEKDYDPSTLGKATVLEIVNYVEKKIITLNRTQTIVINSSILSKCLDAQ